MVGMGTYGMISAKVFTSEAEMRASAAAARKRLFNGGASKPRKAMPAPANGDEYIEHDNVVRLLHLRDQGHHVKAFEAIRPQFDKTRGHKLKRYILIRAIQMGMDFDTMQKKTHKKAVVAVRDRIVWEIKTNIKPDISYPELGRLFLKDHTTMISAFRRGAATAGDTVTADMYWRKKKRMNERNRAAAARKAEAEKGVPA